MEHESLSRHRDRPRSSASSAPWSSGVDKERHRDPYDRSSYHESDREADHHYRRRRYHEDDWAVRSPSSSSSTWAAQPGSISHARSSDTWSHSRLPPPAHYDQRPSRSSSSSGRRHPSHHDEDGSSLHATSSRYLSTGGGNGHGNGSHHGGSGYYASASPSGVTPTTNSTSPSALSTSSTSTGNSLRTPPDLALLHGLLPGKSYDGNGAFGVTSRRYLSIKEIEERLELLDSLDTGAHIETKLPSEPSLPPPKPLAQGIGRVKAKDSGLSPDAPEQPKKAKREEKTASSQMATAVKNTAPPLASTSSGRNSSAVKEKSAAAGDERDVQQLKRKKSVTEEAEEGTASRKDAKMAKKSRSRKESSSTRDYDTPSPSPPPPPSRHREREESRQSSHQATPLSMPTRTWTKEDFTRVANAYQARGRSLKHSGDNRVRSAPPASSSSTRAAVQRVANFEQTEAILLYMYAFWCEDHAAATSTGKAGCIVSNWSSLSGLMHYVCANHEKAKDYPLAGLCRLLEALVLRHVASHEQKQLNVRLSRVVSRSVAAESSSSSSANGSAHPAASPASQASPQNGHESSAASPPTGLQRNQSASVVPTLASLAGASGGASAPALDLTAILSDASSSLAKVVADEERCARLLSVARSSLAPAVLAADFPRVWEKCNRVGTLLDAQATFRDLDPGRMARSAAKEEKVGGDPPQASWAWPIDVGATSAAVLVPHLVNFARALLREGAARREVPFSLAADLP